MKIKKVVEGKPKYFNNNCSLRCGYLRNWQSLCLKYKKKLKFDEIFDGGHLRCPQCLKTFGG